MAKNQVQSLDFRYQGSPCGATAALWSGTLKAQHTSVSESSTGP